VFTLRTLRTFRALRRDGGTGRRFCSIASACQVPREHILGNTFSDNTVTFAHSYAVPCRMLIRSPGTPPRFSLKYFIVSASLEYLRERERERERERDLGFPPLGCRLQGFPPVLASRPRFLPSLYSPSRASKATARSTAAAPSPLEGE